MSTQEKKEEIWLSPLTKNPTPTEKSKKHRDNIKNATKNFDNTTIADRLRAVPTQILLPYSYGTVSNERVEFNPLIRHIANYKIHFWLPD